MLHAARWIVHLPWKHLRICIRICIRIFQSDSRTKIKEIKSNCQLECQSKTRLIIFLLHSRARVVRKQKKTCTSIKRKTAHNATEICIAISPVTRPYSCCCYCCRCSCSSAICPSDCWLTFCNFTSNVCMFFLCISPCSFMYYYASTFRKQHCRAPINLAVLSLIESGQLARLQAKWWHERNLCQYNDIRDTAHNELSLSHVAGLFFILIGGLLLALVVALIEFCFKGRNDGRQRAASGSRSNAHGHNQTGHGGKQHTDTMKSKSKLSIQSGREYDNGRVGVSEVGRVKRCKVHMTWGSSSSGGDKTLVS